MNPNRSLQLPPQIFQLKVTLLHITPPIWRRLWIHSHTTLSRFHPILQTSMGWLDSHLHQYIAGRETFMEPDPENAELMPVPKSSRRVRLEDVLQREGASILYLYDFGDSWLHRIDLEATHRPDPAQTYPVCIGGERACPPEDCGGVGGYEQLCQVLSDPKHPEYGEYREWLGGIYKNYDPNGVDLEAINHQLQQ